MDNNTENSFEDQDTTITLTFENDLVVECSVEAIFSVGDKEYMALLPVEEVEGIDPDELFIYRYTPTEDTEDVQLESIEDDDEYEAVADAFEQLVEEYCDTVEDEE